MILTRGKIPGYVKIIRSIGESGNDPWFLPEEVNGENQGLLPEVFGWNNFGKDVDFNRQSRFRYTFPFWNFGQARRLARCLHIRPLENKTVTRLRDLDFWIVGQQRRVKWREFFGPVNFPFL